jgi:hypothetical protein
MYSDLWLQWTLSDVRFEVLTVVKMSMLVFWIVMLCGLEALKMERVCFSETLVSTYKSTWCYNPEDQYHQLWKMLKIYCLNRHENLYVIFIKVICHVFVWILHIISLSVPLFVYLKLGLTYTFHQPQYTTSALFCPPAMCY